MAVQVVAIPIIRTVMEEELEEGPPVETAKQPYTATVGPRARAAAVVQVPAMAHPLPAVTAVVPSTGAEDLEVPVERMEAEPVVPAVINPIPIRPAAAAVVPGIMAAAAAVAMIMTILPAAAGVEVLPIRPVQARAPLPEVVHLPGTAATLTTPTMPVREVTGGYTYGDGNYGNDGRVVISYSPTITLDDHAMGQESNKFAGYTWVRAGEVFAFSLTNSSGSQVTVTQVQFQLSSVTGISQTDIGNFLIYVDTNNDGAIGTGETTTVGGSGSVNSGPTTITFSTSFNIAASTTVNYILIGDAANLASGDKMTIALGSSNITLSSGSKGGSTTSVTQAANPTKATYSTATSGTSWVVPTGVTSITVKAWGGGAGGGGGSDYYSGGTGAGAGFAQATLSVTAGETLSVRVGGGGGGGNSGTNAGGGGGGGGYSGIYRSSTTLIIAAGGGGGGGAGNASGYQGGEWRWNHR